MPFIRQQLLKAGVNVEFGSTKTTDSQQVVTLPEILVEELKGLKERQENEKNILGDDYRDYDLVFAIPGGGAIIPRNFVKQFKSLLRKAGIPESIRFHDLRHSHASLY